jgi:hypothetical protein
VSNLRPFVAIFFVQDQSCTHHSEHLCIKDKIDPFSWGSAHKMIVSSMVVITMAVSISNQKIRPLKTANTKQWAKLATELGMGHLPNGL